MSDNGVYLQKVGRYYSGKIAAHGTTAQGVDWNGDASQQLRFTQLLRIIDTSEPFSLNDLGCGYGALLERMEQEGYRSDYLGIDLSEAMIAAARERHGDGDRVRFEVGQRFERIADYTVASGIFNVKLDVPSNDWRDYVIKTVTEMVAASKRGVAFNCLTAYSDADKMRDDLYYADPLELFDYCKRHLAGNVALLHDYGLYEFTLLIRKEL